MEEDRDCIALRENPELFRIILLNATEELAACMSDECATTLLKQQDSEALQQQVQILQMEFKKSVKELLNNMWNELQISHKVSLVHQLESKFPPHYIAWRPSTGEIPIVNLRGHYLEDIRGRLLYKINKCKAESQELQNSLYTKATVLRNSLKKIHNSEEALMILYKDCEEILKGDCSKQI